jgi:hypothetical protein
MADLPDRDNSRKPLEQLREEVLTPGEARSSVSATVERHPSPSRGAGGTCGCRAPIAVGRLEFDPTALRGVKCAEAAGE